MSRDDVGYRTYQVTFRVKAATTDGPFNVFRTPGIFLPGASWIVDDDFDPWVWCLPTMTVTPVVKGEPNKDWEVTQTFTNKPPTRQRCNAVPIEDPLLEPQKISGSFSKFLKEATHDRFGEPITNSCHEQFRGQQVEFDNNRPTVKIEQNVADLELDLFSDMVDTVNIDELWGLPARTIKLSNVSWERKYQGTCQAYFTRILEFEVNFDTFDRDLLDEGTKVINGHWGRGGNEGHHWVIDPLPGGLKPDPLNPAHFIRAVDRVGNPMKVILNGHGKPVDLEPGTGTGSSDDAAGSIHIEYYPESDFLLLGIPVVLG